MTRTLVGLMALGCLVGIGSAGVYFAHHLLTSSQPAAPAVEVDAAVPMETTPTPIPLPAQAAAPASPANPFARTAQAEQVAVAENRYADDPQAANPYAGERYQDNRYVEREPQPLPRAEQYAAESSEGAAGAAQDGMPATRSADPFGLRDTRTSMRYAEQPASAEMVEDEAQPLEEQVAEEPAELQEEPRRLSQSRRQTRERYGRAAESSSDLGYADHLAAEPEPVAEEPAEEAPLVEEEPAVGEEEPIAEAEEGGVEPAALPAESQEPAVIDEGTGRPGDPRLSGSQAPTLTIEKTAPPEIQIGKAAKFVIKVRNAGSVVAHGVEIHDTIPQGTQLIDTSPAAERGPQGALVWEMGSLKAGDERTVELQLMPTAEGEIGSVATVHFKAEASVRTVATKPMLQLDVTGPQRVLKGEEVTLRIRLSNPGSGAAAGVVLSEKVPQGLSHAAGHELEFEVGTLAPGESRELELALVAAAAGHVVNILSARGDANLQAEVKTELEVVAPQLQVSLSGPKRRYLERNATHNISVSNPGTAPAKDIELVAVLPRELKFVQANNGGQFDEATHSVYWSLEELPPQETGTVTLVTLPQQPGDAKLLIKSSTQQGLEDQREEVLAIEGLAAINFQLSDAADPIEVGGQTSYEVRVTNQGTKAASNIRLVALAPRDMKPLGAEGPVRYKIEGQRIVFEPLKSLAPKAESSFTIKVQALQPGDLRLQVQVTTDEIRDPITKEESTRVYGNE